MARRRYYRRKTNSVNELLVVLALFSVALYVQYGHQYGNAILMYGSLMLLIFLGIAVVALVVIRRREQRKLRALNIAAIDSMDPLKFEEYVAQLLRHRGFNKVRLTERYDYGVDVLAQMDGVMWGVQVKRYSGLVKAEAVRQVFTALVRYKCDRAMVITNSTFSRPARELAKDNNCELIDRDVLAQWIVEFQMQS